MMKRKGFYDEGTLMLEAVFSMTIILFVMIALISFGFYLYQFTTIQYVCNASILKTNEGCFIRDLGSLNHTYLNDTLIEVRTEKLIPNGAIIRMGNERFQFECVGALNG